MPWAGEPAFRCDNTVLERGAIMSAVCVQCVNLVLHLDEQYFSALNALDFHLLLVAILQVYGRKVLQFPLGHGGSSAGKRASL